MSRRAKGEGYHWIEKATGQHRYRIRKGSKDFHVSDSDPKRAKEKFRELKKKLDDGLKVADARQTFDRYARTYLDNALRVGESTAHDYARRLGYYILPWLGDYALDALTIDIGEAWLKALAREGKAVSTITQSLRLAQRILDRAVTARLISYNPFATIKPPRAAHIETDDEEEGATAFTPEQERALLQYALTHDKHWTATTGKTGRSVRGEGLYLLYLLAFRLGLRRGELLGLRRRDIDFDQGVIRIRQQVCKVGNEVRATKKLKTPAARRDLPLLAEVGSVLSPHLLRIADDPEALLFPGRTGGPRHPDAVTRQFSRALRCLGFTGFSLHDCRHTAVTRWRERRIDAETVASLAGHEKPNVSLEVYSAVTIERKRRALGE